MKTSIIIKKTLAYPIDTFNRMTRRNEYKAKNEYFILMYHRIMNKDNKKYVLQDGMHVNPSTFSKQIEYIKNNYSVISLENIFSITSLSKKERNNKPYCVITFDDGWKDIYENAYNVLKKNNVCATIFLPTSYIGTNKWFWVDKLAHILKINENEKYKYRHISESTNSIVNIIENMKGSLECKIERSIKILKPIKIENIDIILNELAKKWQVDLDINHNSFLSWEEIKEMRSSGLVSFGSHTENHLILTTASENVIRRELIRSKHKLLEEKVVTTSFVPFAYPNGNYTNRIAEIVEEAGYRLALTTEYGWNRISNDRRNLYKLKRISIHQDIASTNAMFSCRVHGVY